MAGIDAQQLLYMLASAIATKRAQALLSAFGGWAAMPTTAAGTQPATGAEHGLHCNACVRRRAAHLAVASGGRWAAFVRERLLTPSNAYA